MLDTISLFIPLSTMVRNSIYACINASIKDNNSTAMLHLENSSGKNFRRYVTSGFYNFGILELALEDHKIHYDNINTFRHELVVKFKPAIIMHSNDEYALSDYQDKVPAASLFNSFIKTINEHIPIQTLKFPYINDWGIKRIDYAFQICTPYHIEYLQLFRRGKHLETCTDYGSSLKFTNGNWC